MCIRDSNNIGDVGATAIGKALETNATLSELNLRDNNIGDVGAIAIEKALVTNATLSELYLGVNNIGKETKQTLNNIQKYKREGTNGYKQVEGMIICF